MTEITAKLLKQSIPISVDTGFFGANKTCQETHKTFKAIFKPKKGETKRLREFHIISPSVPYYKREILAYELDQLFGFNLVPLTVKVRKNGTEGSRQFWIENVESADKIYQWGSTTRLAKKGKYKNEASKLAFFDIVAGNCDRHQGNFLIDKKQCKFYAIDNGLCFPLVMEHFVCDLFNCSEKKDIESGKIEKFSFLFDSLSPTEKANIRSISCKKFMSLFKKYRLEKEGREAWNRFKKLIPKKAQNENY